MRSISFICRVVMMTGLVFVLIQPGLCVQSDTLDVDQYLDQVVITAQFTPTDTRQTVNSVKILNRKTIEQRSLVSFQELLQTETNIRVSQDPILGSVLSINALKGENLKILIDGVPVIGRMNGNVDAGQLPLNAIQKVEIIEGAQSLLYGSDASGGVINIITRKNQAKKIDSEVTGQYENNGFRQATASLGYAAGKWIVQANGNIQDFQPSRDSTMGRDQLWNPKMQKSARGMVRFTPDETTDFRLTSQILNEKIDNLGELKRPQFKPYAFDDYYITDKFDVSLHGEKWTNKKRLIQATVGWNTFYRIKNSYRHDFDNNYDELLEGLQDTSSSKGLLARLTLASDKPSDKIGYLLGVENYYEIATGTRLEDTTLSASGRAYSNDLGVFGSAKWRVSHHWTLQSGVRWTNNLRYGSAFTPSTWVHWQPELPVQWRMSWAYGFRSPAIKELYFSFVDVNHYVKGNPDLNPEKSINLRSEFTWNTYTARDLNVVTTITGFYNHIDDKIILTALGPVHYEYQNVDKFITLGGGIGVEVKFQDWLRLRSDWVNTGFNNTNGSTEETKNDLLWSVDMTNDLTISILDGYLTWSIWHKLTGKTPYFFNQDGKILQGSTDQWNLLNTGLSTQLFNNKIRLNAGIKNIFDIRELKINNLNGIHIEASNQQGLHWGRTMYVGMAVKF